MNFLAIVLTFSLLGAVYVLAEDGPTEGPTETATKKPINWAEFKDKLHDKWVIVLGYYATLTRELQTLKYDMGKIASYVDEALKAWEADFDTKMANYTEEMKTELKQILKDSFPTFPEPTWSSDLVEKVDESIQKYIQDPQAAATAMSKCLGTTLAFRTSMKNQMNQNVADGEKVKESDYNKMGDCVEFVYQGIIRHFESQTPCDDNNEDFFRKCQETCVKYFENQA